MVSKRRTEGRQEAGQVVEVRKLGRVFSNFFTRAGGERIGKAGWGVEDTAETACRAAMKRVGFSTATDRAEGNQGHRFGAGETVTRRCDGVGDVNRVDEA
jgi:hypothetical protein